MANREMLQVTESLDVVEERLNSFATLEVIEAVEANSDSDASALPVIETAPDPKKREKKPAAPPDTKPDTPPETGGE
jgi:hypothetical protein